MAKDAYYFRHDSNTRNDPKIIKLRRVMGREGSDVFFDILSLLREQADYRLPEQSVPDLAYNLRYPEQKLKKILTDFDLFAIHDGYFYSKRLIRDMQEWDEQKLFYKERAKKGGIAKAQKKAASNMLEADEKQEKKLLDPAIKQINKQINKQIKDDFVVTPPPAIDGFRDVEEQKQRALSDESYVAQVSQMGIDPLIVSKWLDAFNRFLRFGGNTLKQEKDYRHHFPRWLAKIPGYRTMEPEQYQPAGIAPEQSKGRKVVMDYFDGSQATWTEERYEQYRNNRSAAGYTFVRYED